MQFQKCYYPIILFTIGPVTAATDSKEKSSSLPHQLSSLVLKILTGKSVTVKEFPDIFQVLCFKLWNYIFSFTVCAATFVYNAFASIIHFAYNVDANNCLVTVGSLLLCSKLIPKFV